MRSTLLQPPLSADAVSLAPRSAGLTGALSLHDYRRQLASTEFLDDPVDRRDKILKRKPATVNLKRSPTPPSLPLYAASIDSSRASSPPPLSPSYSQSVVSQRSEQDDAFDLPSASFPIQAPRVHVSDLKRPRPNRKRLNTFREKLRQRQIQAQAQTLPPVSQTSDAMLASTQAVATISHEGTSFDILNPRKSLDLARIVSFIEDVDTCPFLPGDHTRDSRMSSTFTIDETMERASLSQFTDASLPSPYSSRSLYTSLSSTYSMAKDQGIPSSSPRMHDRVRSLSDYSLHGGNCWPYSSPNPDDQNYHDLKNMTKPPQGPAQPEAEAEPSRPIPPSSPTFSFESEIGEPGSPVYANGEWSNVDERDRGILLDERPPSPYDTYYENTMSPTYAQHYDPDDPYSPIFFDPHVQSVLAAANAENMGLRGHPAKALDDLQRKFQNSVSLAGDGKDGKSLSQRRRFRKLFSWKS
ncbi:hypothetical protein N7468_006982 [Penicillium chermesinum]|uniref:Uncharacterized protein n=1 Tax=Penicillium chermesinum TaxID=63820 RepID=A0A9W9NTB2_9EURO|nr:uncharacterized protein N7468_006982 [Penicillium chermesinum]KAJ5225757.1 hypothetical protein N7468_006982 [Penicillium chermesinum]